MLNKKLIIGFIIALIALIVVGFIALNFVPTGDLINLNVTDNTGLDDIYDHIKTNEGMSDKPGEKDGVQLFKVTGKIDPKEIAKHIQDSRNNAPKEAEKDTPTEFYYENKVSGDDIRSKENRAADAKGLVKSVTIKRDPNNDLNKDKKVDQLFKEAADKDGEEEDSSPAYYYYTKVLGDGKDVKPETLDIQQIQPDTKVDDIYNQLKLKGGLMDMPKDDDGIQIFKVVGDADTKDIVEHMKKAGDKRNNKPGNDGALRSANTGAKRPHLPVKGKDGKDIEPVTKFEEDKSFVPYKLLKAKSNRIQINEYIKYIKSNNNNNNTNNNNKNN